MDTPHSKDGTDAPDFNDDGIYGKNYDNEDEDFSYHLSDGLAEEEIDNHGELGADAVGMSPLVTSASSKVGKVDDLPKWLQEITRNQMYDKTDLLATCSSCYPNLSLYCLQRQQECPRPLNMDSDLPAEVKHNHMGSL